MSTVQAIRTVLFYLLLSASAFVWGTLSFFIAPILPFRAPATASWYRTGAASRSG